jgi:hypothetical protein
MVAIVALISAMVVACRPAGNSSSSDPNAALRVGGPVPSDSPYRMDNAIQDVMEGIVAPSADILFDAVATDITAEGVNEKRPTTDDDWEKVEHAAVELIEGVNMIKMPGRLVARPGEKTKSEGPDAPELTAEEIAAKINMDRNKFLKYANDLQDQAVKTLAIIHNKDAQGLFNVGEDIDNACEACHLEYWYPNDKQAKAAYEANQKLKEQEEQQKKNQGK